MLHVDSATQRVGTSAVLPQGSLIAGLEQWVGISVLSLHDTVSDASVIVSGLDGGEASASGTSATPLRLNPKQQGYIAGLDGCQGLSQDVSNCPVFLEENKARTWRQEWLADSQGHRAFLLTRMTCKERRQ